jgi:phosphohistidine phosphatase
MRTLLLLRHAKADRAPGSSDHDRPLTARGERASAAMGEHLSRIGARPGCVLCSSARRTTQTWRAVESAWGVEPRLVVSDRLYLASAAELLDVLREQPDEIACVLLIGHNPGIQDLAVALAGEGDRDAYDRLRRKLPTAGLCELAFEGSWAGLRPGAARLVRFDVPKNLPDRAA